jgi:PAS domain-containing protein
MVLSAREQLLTFDKRLLQASLEDITQSRKTEEALRESRQLLQSVLENSPAVIYAKRKDGSYTYINREWERVCDLVRERVMARLFQWRVSDPRWQIRGDQTALHDAETSIPSPYGSFLLRHIVGRVLRHTTPRLDSGPGWRDFRFLSFRLFVHGPAF